MGASHVVSEVGMVIAGVNAFIMFQPQCRAPISHDFVVNDGRGFKKKEAGKQK